VGFVYLGVMVLTWAGNWPLMKLALGEVPPLVFVLLRLIVSTPERKCINGPE
jgi:drug/metabolite transporter (DMT)-like permease